MHLYAITCEGDFIDQQWGRRDLNLQSKQCHTQFNGLYCVPIIQYYWQGQYRVYQSRHVLRIKM